MTRDNIIQKKSYEFAIRVVNAYKFLSNEQKEFVLSKQLLKSGTSVGANIEEAIGAQSDKDFLHKFSIAYKEARESLYWIKLLNSTEFLNDEVAKSLISEVTEILKIISKIQVTTKAKLNS